MEDPHKYVESAMASEGRYTDNAVEVTPALANVLLDMCDDSFQRSESLKKVQEYAAQMMENRWPLGGSPLKVDTLGRLINGQHRLHAVVISQKSILFDITWNASPDEFMTEDAGKVRNPADFVKIGSTFKRDHAKVAAAAKGACYYLADPSAWRSWQGRRPGAEALLEMVNSFTVEEIEAALESAKVFTKSDPKVPLNFNSVAVFVLVQSRMWPTEDGKMILAKYLSALITGEGVYVQGNPVKALREWAMGIGTAARKKKEIPDFVLHLHYLLRHFEAHVMGKELSKPGNVQKADDFTMWKAFSPVSS